MLTCRNPRCTRTLLKLYNICSGEKSTLDSPAQVKLATADGEDKISFDNGCYYANGEKMIKHREHQVLLTAQANSGGGKSSCRCKGQNKGGNAGKGRQAESKDKQNENKSDKKKEKVCWNCNEPGHLNNECPVAEDAEESNLTETLMEDECWIIEEDSQRAVFSKTVLSEEEEVFVAKLASMPRTYNRGRSSRWFKFLLIQNHNGENLV